MLVGELVQRCVIVCLIPGDALHGVGSLCLMRAESNNDLQLLCSYEVLRFIVTRIRLG